MPSLFMPEMTNLQVRDYLQGGGRTVIVPVGSTEQHGDHGPLWTDVYIPLEIARRAAPRLNALVGPPIPFGLAADHRSGLVYLRLETFVALLRDVCAALAEDGFRRIVLLNGHYCNTWVLAHACTEMRRDLPADVRLYPFAYWNALPPDQAQEYLSGSAGIHANVGETSIILAINPELADMARARDFTPDLGPLHTSPFAILDPVCLGTPGSFWRMLERGGGVWGAPSQSTAEKGERFLGQIVEGVIRLVADMDAVYDRLASPEGVPNARR